MTDAVGLGAHAEARKSRPVTLDPAAPASAAFVTVAGECTDHWRTNAGLLLESRAMPHLHQTRVGIRRLRSSFSLFRPLLRDVPGAFFMAHRLRSLALPFGAARDLDVLLSGPLVDDLDEEQVARLGADREAAYDVVHAILRSPDWADAARSLDGLVLLAPWHGVVDPPARDLAAGALEKRWHRVVGHVDTLAAMDPAARHRVRIEAKKLRYACEFFASLFPTDSPTAVTGSGEHLAGPLALGWHVEQVQTALGAVNDHATADGLLRAVGSAAPAVDEHRLVVEAVEAVRSLSRLDPFWR
jgi:CHAD domain-containing protein